jgi:hypothetical protein
MKHAELLRIYKRQDGVFGALSINEFPICLTVERPWLDNKVGLSCIPPGQYLCKRVESPKFGVTFEVSKVPGRSEILFHSGNISDDSHGCIILGESFNRWSTGQLSLGSSRIAFSEFMQELSGQDSFQLQITEVF